MRITSILAASLAVLIGASLLSAGAPAVAGDGDAKTPSGVWVYDIRVVRVDPPMAEGAEQPSPFPEMKATTISLPWAECLARLKKRGTTTLLLDQRLTALQGRGSNVSEETTTPLLSANFEDKNNVQYRAQVVRTGCSFEQTTTGPSFQYQVQIQGALTAPADKAPPIQYTVKWRGDHPRLDGATLVLVNRRQVAKAKGAASKALEHYAFVTGRFVPSR
ncbi:MAG: hypothetical protein P1V36_16585 [Planctomycetota bacterium]|nr:hypothetical protein [Planctomycetota bacterium]